MKKILFTLCGVMIVSGVLFSGCSAEPGLLHGQVYIGPLSPVEQPGESPAFSCGAYEARKIMIYDKSGERLIEQVNIDCSEAEQYARYRVELKPGIYTVKINRIGADFSDDVPAQVEIMSGITTRLDIDIDTGIR